MKTHASTVIAAAVLLFCSCIPSVNPYCTDRDLIFDPHLVGEWREKEHPSEGSAWIFEKGEGSVYKLTVTEKGKRGEFAARLFQLKKDYFLDLVPTDYSYNSNQIDVVEAAMFPGHLLMHVPQREPELKMAFVNFDWLADYLKKNPRVIQHHVENDRLLLTADTSDLQQFVSKHLGQGELFKDYATMMRGTNGPSAEKRN